MSALPGATGKDPSHAPEEAYAGLQKYNNVFLKFAEKLTPDLAAQLISPILEWHSFVRFALDIYNAIDTRTDHELQGWIESGHTTFEWRPSTELGWLPHSALLALPAHEQEAINALVTNTPGYTRLRKLSPREVMQRGSSELTKLPGHALPILLGPELGKKSRVTKDLLFTVQDEEAFAEPIHFAALLNGFERLERGKEYLLYVNPFGSDVAQVCDMDGSYLGWVQLYDRLSKTDVEALNRAAGHSAKVFAEEIQDVQRWKSKTIRRARDMHAHNKAVAKGTHEKAARLPNTRDLAAATKRSHEESPQEEDGVSPEDVSNLFRT